MCLLIRTNVCEQVMELETQVQVSGNQLRRQDQDIKQLREELELSASREKELTAKLREQQHRYTDLESKVNVVTFPFLVRSLVAVNQ